MRDPCDRFALRYLAAVVCGLALLLFHGAADSGLPAAFVPQCASPWELSKLAFWPGLAAWVMTSRLGGARRPLLRDLPAAVLAASMAFCPDGEKHPVLWTALALALAGLYMLLTFTPPAWGPFLAPPG